MLADAEENADGTETEREGMFGCSLLRDLSRIPDTYTLLPLEQVAQPPKRSLLGSSDDDQVFEDQARDLKGLRVGMSLSHYGSSGSGGISNWQKCVPNICSEWLTMEVVPDISSTTKADFLLWSYEYKYAQCI
ncbi:hypothetical protein E4U35_000668 [Claviceps purpurea]|nr:hypothetical protein E4U35_000668 [Claviceps purpurea]